MLELNESLGDTVFLCGESFERFKVFYKLFDLCILKWYVEIVFHSIMFHTSFKREYTLELN